MKASKLVQLLEKLDAKGLRRLGEYLNSPIFNKHEEFRNFYERLRKEAPDFAEGKVDREVIWADLYPDQEFDAAKMGHLMSFTLKLAEAWMGFEFYLSDPLLVQIHKVDALNSLDLDKHYRLSERKVQSTLEGDPTRNDEYYLRKFLLANVQTKFFARKRLRSYDASLQEAQDALDIFYIIRKLRLSCELINRQNILSVSYDVKLVDELASFVDRYGFDEVPAVAIYYRILLLLTDPHNEQHFLDLRQLLDQHGDLFSLSDRAEIYAYAQNYCIARVKEGKQVFLKQLFELYQSALENGLLYGEDPLSPWNYKNIASVGLRLGEFEWTRDFIDRCRPYLSPEYQDNAYAYNLANLYYHEGKYSDALKTLAQVEFSDVFYSLDTKKMMLRIYFEQGAIEPLHSLIASFRIFLKRNKLISDRHREAYLNFVEGVQLLQKSKDGNQSSIGDRLSNLQPIVDEDWLLAKAS